jgi:hypothetical protein
METLFEAIRIVIQATGVAVWVVIIFTFSGIAALALKDWSGWGRLKNWWWLANGGRER